MTKLTRRPNGSENISAVVARRVILLVCLFGLLASGCGLFEPSRPLQVPPPPDQQTQPVPSGLAEQAQKAWESGNYIQAEALYKKILTEQGLSPAQRSQAWERLSRSSLANRNFAATLDACKRWAGEQPSARTQTAWQDCWIKSLAGLGRTTANEDLLMKTWTDNGQPLRLRAQAGLLLAVWQRDDQELLGKALEAFDELHRRADASKADTEALLLSGLEGLSDDAIGLAAFSPAASRANSLPYAAIRFEQARRSLRTEQGRAFALQMLNELKKSSALTDKTPIDKLLSAPGDSAGVPDLSAPATIEMAMLLPSSGPYASIAQKIMRGAEAAKQELFLQGHKVTLIMINSEDPSWMQTFANLPPSVRIVGGPINPNALKALKGSGQLGQRAIFAFMSDLGELGEGRDGWRFFFSQADQSRALLEFAVDGCGIKRLGTLAPDEPYGHRMAQVFRQQAVTYGLDIGPSAVATYPPDQSADWNKVVARMLNVPVGSKGTVAPNTPFEAVFMPDGWSQAELLIPNFYYYGEERLLFMGPALWTQDFIEGKKVIGQNPDFIISPGMWWPENYAPAAADLKAALATLGQGDADMWVALGYDFVRFSSRLGPYLYPFAPDRLNQGLATTAETMNWSIAPISWDPLGRASQRLFVFSPAGRGVQLADPTTTSTSLSRARAAGAR